MRNRKYSVLLPIIGIAQFSLIPQAGAWGWLLIWSGFAWLLMGIAYATGRAELLGKRPDGTVNPLSLLLLLPYLLFAWVMWRFNTRAGKSIAYNEIQPGLWLGRRPAANDLPDGVTLIVDLTTEFAAPRSVLKNRQYLCVPSLDASIPKADAFIAAVEQIRRHDGGTLVHCALGRGRSAAVVAGVLIAKGVAANTEEAERMMKSLRPEVGLNAVQKQFLKSIEGKLHQMR